MIERNHQEREAASRVAAQAVAAALRRRLRGQEEAAAVIAGGSTPRACYGLLSRMKLDFSRVHFVPSDERWVPGDDDDSNESMLRSSLLGGRAADAHFMSFYQPSMGCREACQVLAKRFEKLPLPLAVALLGMGEDGHFASLFPDLPGLASALDPYAGDLCISGATAASPHARVSLTMRALTWSDEILLLAFGARKKKVIDAARAGEEKYPLTALFAQSRAPVRVIWAP
jgi:6-phosphogluconolactonase